MKRDVTFGQPRNESGGGIGGGHFASGYEQDHRGACMRAGAGGGNCRLPRIG